jgi:hypothetical protein
VGSSAGGSTQGSPPAKTFFIISINALGQIVRKRIQNSTGDFVNWSSWTNVLFLLPMEGFAPQMHSEPEIEKFSKYS